MNLPDCQLDPESVLAIYAKIPGQKMDLPAAYTMAAVVRGHVKNALENAHLLLSVPPSTQRTITAMFKLLGGPPKVPPSTRKMHEALEAQHAALREQLDLLRKTPGVAAATIENLSKRLTEMERNLAQLRGSVGEMEAISLVFEGYSRNACDGAAIFLLPGQGCFILLAHVKEMVPALLAVKGAMESASLLPFCEIAHGDLELNDFRTFHPPGCIQPFARHFALFHESLTKAAVIFGRLLSGTDPDQPPSRLS